jgi:Tol biopolymer transport system component
VPGASEPGVIEIFPVWTPDGKSIIFSRAPAGLHPALTKYQLWIVPLEGPDAGKAHPIAGAQDPAMSSYYGRFSPDGKWFSFTRSVSGTLIKSSSDIWIMRADLAGAAHPLECNVPFAADSWHSWSRSGRWIVFASKRDDGIFARLYLTRVGDDGKASPAVPLPIPRLPLASFNLPEFVPEAPDISEPKLYDSVGIGRPSTFVKQTPAGGAR